MSYDPLTVNAVSTELPHPPTYWRSTHKVVSRNPLAQDIQCEWLIVGAGYTGLAAACELKRHSARSDVVVVDSHDIGFGCAGRNGGFVLSGTGRYSLPAIAKKWGVEVAVKMHGEWQSAVNALNKHIMQGNIQCDLSSGPYLKIAHNAKQANLLRLAVETNKRDFDIDANFLSPAKLASQLKIEHAYGASIQPGQSLNPLKYVDGLARLAENDGVTIHTRTPAESIERTANGWKIKTPQATINAENILLASNAYSPRQFHPMIDKRQFPVQSSIIVTAPISNSVRETTGLNKAMTMMDTRMMKYYYRTLPDGRLLFGGRGAVAGKNADSPLAKNRLIDAMTASFPSLKHIDIDYFWSGWVSVALDSMPRVVFDEKQRIGYSMGYCGSGVSFATLAGARLVQRALGEKLDTSLPLYRNALPKYPMPAMRRMGLRALYTWAHLFE
ncbi:NAD(P)/FAD-dependent oxidoreductase [Alteromonas sp. ASW11-130]|uniref:NAD(P)/FAD-dependent oxidoreductase n=1 Tax=Alteromonas sp. ASW11-130 TaxID=3015775 RepID=UPI002241D5E9|nr:FAD-dependent oxidoreductase [Alteromonas sp. ASW11-130]MCW8091706.1 FAD-binding oxidoreductase [Alteromonas sp. ASW11-130]